LNLVLVFQVPAFASQSAIDLYTGRNPKSDHLRRKIFSGSVVSSAASS